ncbi:MAG: radical SAM protein [Candidatus Omnitrophota bacterium]|nr:MAG: radical SAM protein [Candidatus Omnitrophota bacterium]RKY35057.1 MAG: radical SAM protein [Candidatus Omnitrophota bacterium]RKY44416.1 MAG: radical SAM protein [Candidatus Omnitrophota bacterium]
MENFIPSYLKLSSSSLENIKNSLLELLRECIVCPRNCKVNRFGGEKGFCRTARFSLVSTFNLHFGEEPELVGRGGSGTIFFSFCNLACQFCQNYTISHLGEGEETDSEKLAKIILYLQSQGAHNINLVSPTHVLPQIVEALIIARDRGLRLPLVYNSGGYDSKQVLKIAEGVFDIYMPDMKYSDNELAKKYSLVEDYWEVCQEAVLEMYRQVGDLVIDSQGVAQRGLIIRHLVLPNNISGSFKVIDFIAEKISKDTYLNIMDQYWPCYKAYNFSELSRRITLKEYKEVVNYALKRGLRRGFFDS